MISNQERRARLGARHHLARPAPDPVAVAGDLVGLHSSDPATVVLAARARVDGFTVADLDDALYERRELIRLLGMRRTMFVVPVDLAPTIDAACTRIYSARERVRLAGMLEDQAIADDGHAWVRAAEQRTLDVLSDLGEATGSELRDHVPEFEESLMFGEGTKWAGRMGVSTRILFLLATEGRIVRGRPRGSWLSSQYRWVRTDRWIDGGIPDHDEDEARAELVRRYLGAFGPATFEDVKWWTGWGVRVTRAALAGAGAEEVDLETGPGYTAPGDAGAGPPSHGPWAALLPSLDPTVMGWKERDWYLGGHTEALFDRNGNAGPTVWWDGRIVGGWSQQEDGTIAYRLLEDVGHAAEEAVEREAHDVETWMADVVVTPRFRTPLEQDFRG